MQLRPSTTKRSHSLTSDFSLAACLFVVIPNRQHMVIILLQGETGWHPAVKPPLLHSDPFSPMFVFHPGLQRSRTNRPIGITKAQNLSETAGGISEVKAGGSLLHRRNSKQLNYRCLVFKILQRQKLTLCLQPADRAQGFARRGSE